MYTVVLKSMLCTGPAEAPNKKVLSLICEHIGARN